MAHYDHKLDADLLWGQETFLGDSKKVNPDGLAIFNLNIKPFTELNLN